MDKYDTFYFCMYLTENEHWCMQSTIEKFLETCANAKLVYYRQLKDGHVPMHREVKIEGSQSSVEHFKRWFASTPSPQTAYSLDSVPNPHKV
jgi:hypothetical protein